MLVNQIQFSENSDWTDLENDGVSLVLYLPCHHWIWLEVLIYPNPCLCIQTNTAVNQREDGLCSCLLITAVAELEHSDFEGQSDSPGALELTFGI